MGASEGVPEGRIAIPPIQMICNRSRRIEQFFSVGFTLNIAVSLRTLQYQPQYHAHDLEFDDSLSETARDCQ